MNTVNVYIKGQEGKELISFLRYFPSRIKNIGMDAVFDRQIVYDYKDGRNHLEVRNEKQTFFRACMQVLRSH